MSQNKNYEISEKRQNDSSTSNMYCNLKSVNMCNINRNRKPCTPAALRCESEDHLFENNLKDCQKGETPLKQYDNSNNSISVENINSNEHSTHKSQLDIRSPLAKRIILQSQSRGVLPETNIVQTNSKTQRMVSVLKNPLNAPQSPFSTNEDYENMRKMIVKINHYQGRNSSNNEIQNIIVPSTENIQNMLSHEEGKTDLVEKPRKLTLTEYLSRKNKMTQEKKSPTVLKYVYHAATKTELVIKDDPDNPEIWCEREIISVLKDESQLKEEKNKSKPLTCDAKVQTYETMFESPTNTVVDAVQKDEKR